MHHPYTVRQGYDFGLASHDSRTVRRPVLVAQEPVTRIEIVYDRGRSVYIHQVWWKKMMTGPNPARWVKAIRRDRWIAWAFIGGMLALYLYRHDLR